MSCWISFWWVELVVVMCGMVFSWCLCVSCCMMVSVRLCVELFVLYVIDMNVGCSVPSFLIVV